MVGKPDLKSYGGDGHCYEQQLKNWLTRDDPTRDKNQTSGSILRSELNSAIKKETGR